jgi:glycosyltransferase involved in cell wall biosynthesis
LEKADAIIAVSEALKRSMIDLGVSPHKIQVITNGVDPTCFKFVARDEARRRLGISGECSIIVSVGSLIPSKGHELLIRAFGQVLQKHNGLRLYILGEGPHRQVLEFLVARLGLTNSVHLPGKRPNEQLPLWFSAARLSCLTTEREGWPNVLTESLACGTPVVATRVGGIPEIIHSEQLGILVDQTEDSVARGIEEGLARDWNREDISRQTRKRTWDDVAAEVEEVLRRAMRVRHLPNRNHGGYF